MHSWSSTALLQIREVGEAPRQKDPNFIPRAPWLRRLVVKRAESLLLKTRMKLDLIDRWRDARFANDPFEVIAIEIRDADRANASLFFADE